MASRFKISRNTIKALYRRGLIEEDNRTEEYLEKLKKGEITSYLGTDVVYYRIKERK